MLVSETLELRPTIYSAPEMRNDYGAADDETYRERFEQHGARHALFGTAGEMIRHAVIAAEHERRNEAEQLLGFPVERACFVGACVEREEAVDNQISLAQDFFVHPFAKLAELLERTWLAVLVRGGPMRHLWLSRSLSPAQKFHPLSVLIAFSN